MAMHPGEEIKKKPEPIPLGTRNPFYFIELYAKLVCNFGIVRANWCNDQRLLQHDTSNSRIVRQCLFVVSWFILLVGCAIGFNHLRHIFELSLLGHIVTILSSLILTAYLGLVIMLVAFAWTNDSLVHLFNLLLALSYKIGTNYESTKFRHLQIFYVVSVGCTAPFIAAILHAYLTFTLASNLPLAIIVSLVSLPLSSGSILFIGFFQTYIYLFFKIVGECSTFRMSPKSMDDFTKYYRSATIISNTFSQSFCKVIVPIAKYTCTLVAMISLLFALELKKLNVPGSVILAFIFLGWAIYSYCMLVVGVNMLTSVWEVSTACINHFGRINTLKHSEVHGELKKYIKLVSVSLLPLRFAIGDFYYMQKSTKLRFTSFLIFGTARFLVGFN